MELVLNTFGTSLSRDNEGFIITHKDGRKRLPVIGIKSIQIGKGVQITSDAVMLAIENEIEILFIDNAGQPVGRVWSSKYGSISTIRKGQLNFTFTNDALVWIKEVISQKIENQQALLLMMQTHDKNTDGIRNKSIFRLEDYRRKIKELDGKFVSDVAPKLRGWEGVASKIYFETLNTFILASLPVRSILLWI